MRAIDFDAMGRPMHVVPSGFVDSGRVRRSDGNLPIYIGLGYPF